MMPFLIAYDLIGLAVGGMLLVAFHKRRTKLADTVRLGLLAAGLVSVALWSQEGPLPMARVLCHGMFCVGAPVMILLGSLRLRHRRGWAFLLLATGLSAEGIYLWSRHIEPFRLEITEERITNEKLAGLTRPITVAVLADLQTSDIGAHEERVFAAIRDRQPDLVVMLGDYIQLDPKIPDYEERLADQVSKLRVLVATLDPPLGIFAVSGDSERTYDKRPLGSEWHRVLFADTKVQNAVRHQFVLPTEPPIQLLGHSPRESRLPRTAVHKAFGEFDGFTIAIGHAPDYMIPVLETVQYNAVFMAGHTHGGQVVIPGYGPPVTQSSVPRWLAAGGVFRRGRTWLVVSRGIGMDRRDAPQVRFWCPPQLIFLELAGS